MLKVCFVVLWILSCAFWHFPKRVAGQDELGEIPEFPEDFEFPEFTCDFPGQFSYAVSIRDRTDDQEHLCGGVVLQSNAVLTAAHCLDPRTTSSATTRPQLHIGGIDSDNPIEVRQTLIAIPHEGWEGVVEGPDDLAIIKLDEETCVDPIPQWGVDNAENQEELTFLGYGRTSIGGQFSFTLNGGRMDTFNATHCDERYDLSPQIRESELCARAVQTVGMCTGDEGGPLIWVPTLEEFRDVLIGIASYSSADCTETEGVSVFMNIRNYRRWIEDTLNSDEFLNA